MNAGAGREVAAAIFPARFYFMTRDYFYTKVLPDGRGVYVFPILGGRARVGIGPHGTPFIDDLW